MRESSHLGKKLVAGLVSVLMVGGCLSGCSKNENVVNIFQGKAEIDSVLKTAVKAYQKEHPDVKFNVNSIGGGADYDSIIKSEMSKDVTIFTVGGPEEVAEWGTRLEDLSDQPWISEAIAGTLDGVTKDGKVYGMPVDIEGYGFVYNKDIFEKAGIDASNLKTIDQMDKAFSKLQSQIDSGALKSDFPKLEAVFEFPMKEAWLTGLHATNIALNQEFDSVNDAFNAKTIDFKYADQLKKIIDLQMKYTSSADDSKLLNSVDYSKQVDNGLAIERVAVVQQGSWITPGLIESTPGVEEKLGMLPIPLDNVAEGYIPVGIPMYWAINSEADQASKDAAKDFLNWLYQSEEGKKIVAEDLVFISPFTNGSTDIKGTLNKEVLRYQQERKTTTWVFKGYPSNWGIGCFGTKLQGYANGTISWGDLITSTKEDWSSRRK